ncbi:MAG TPA: cytochrome c peroxidase [Cyclobacteriaceae bacterium]|nr:cytochrome c peroxidase [Cyclobacteriaceae bacterium]
MINRKIRFISASTWPFILMVLMLITLLSLLIEITSCTPEVQTTAERIKTLHLEVLPEVSYPSNNTSGDSKVMLGKLLFWDPVLSGQKDVACVTCHLPNYGYGDGLDLSIGVGGVGVGVSRQQSDQSIPPTGRNAPSIINTAYNGLLNSTQHYDPLNGIMFWDGRRRSLEAQALGPFTSFNTMRGRAYGADVTYDSIIKRLKNIPEYVQLFTQAFGQSESVTIENLTQAIATFERSIVSNNSPYDQYVKGNANALSVDQEEGLLLFFGKANCSSCHSGPMFSDYNYYNLGVPFNSKIPADSGRNKKFLFRTPTLRNVTLTAPFMHSGVYATLEEVLEHYDGGISKNPAIERVDKKMVPLHLTAREKQALLSFLESLTDNQFDQTRPLTVPSGLKPGGNL